MRIGSICTGYGGLDMAVQHVLGGEVAWTSDISTGAIELAGNGVVPQQAQAALADMLPSITQKEATA